MKVANEKHFYKLQELTQEDVSFIENFAIAQSPEGLRPLHRNILRAFTVPFKAKSAAESTGSIAENLLPTIDEAVANTEEDYQMMIETRLQPFLDSMLAGDAGFYADDEKLTTFLYATAVQYFRTKKVKESVIALAEERFKNIRRVWNVLSHIYATNVAYTLFSERYDFRISLANNRTETPFIAGDQPVINVHAPPSRDARPAELEFYYPLSPQRAMFLNKTSKNNCAKWPEVSEQEVYHYNLLVARNSHEQVFSNSEAALKEIQEQLQPSAPSLVSEPRPLR